MPKSRNRKNHKQKVKARNQRIQGIQKKMEKQYTEMLTQKFAEMQSQLSGMTEQSETTEAEVIQPQ